jgi:hypothetical protein
MEISCGVQGIFHDEVVTSGVTTNSALTFAGCQPHTSSVSDLVLMRQKYHCTVHKYICTVNVLAAYDRNASAFEYECYEVEGDTPQFNYHGPKIKIPKQESPMTICTTDTIGTIRSQRLF